MSNVNYTDASNLYAQAMSNNNYAIFNPNNKPEFNEGSFSFIRNKTSVDILATEDKDIVLMLKPLHGFLRRRYKCFKPREFKNKTSVDEETEEENKKKTRSSYSCGISITTDFDNYADFFTSLIKVLSDSLGVDIENLITSCNSGYAPIINCRVPSNHKILEVTEAFNGFFLVALQGLYKPKASDIWKLRFKLVDYKSAPSSSSLPIQW